MPVVICDLGPLDDLGGRKYSRWIRKLASQAPFICSIRRNSIWFCRRLNPMPQRPPKLVFYFHTKEL